MPSKNPFLDYEPLLRRPSSVEEDRGFSSNSAFGREEPLKPKAPPIVAGDAETGGWREGESEGRAERETGRWGEPEIRTENQAAESIVGTSSRQAGSPPSSLLKHGHSVSYIGLFLFTTLVFFRPYELSPSLMWLSKSAFWIAVATILAFVFTQLGLEGTLTARPREVNLVLLLVIAGALSIPLALEPFKAFGSFTEYLKVVAIFLIVVNVVRTQKRLDLLWILVLLASLVLSVGAINDYRQGRFGLQDQRIKGMIGGLFDNPNDLALHLVTMIPIALIFFFRSRNPFTKVISLGAAILLTGGVVSTFSRGGFLGLMVASLVFLWKLSKRSRWLIPPLALTVVLAFVVAAPGGYRARISTTGDDSALARFDDLKRSAFVALRHPLFGVGMDNYILFSNSNKASHNAYTQVAAEMGLAAAVIYVLFLIAPFRGLRRIERAEAGQKKNRNYYFAVIALQASLAGYMVTSFFASVAYLWYIYYLVGYAVCIQRLYDSRRVPELVTERNPEFHPALR